MIFHMRSLRKFLRASIVALFREISIYERKNSISRFTVNEEHSVSERNCKKINE